MTRLNIVCSPLEKLACGAGTASARTCRHESLSRPGSAINASTARPCQRPYATISSARPKPPPPQQGEPRNTKPLIIPFASSSRHPGQSFKPPPLAYIRSHLPLAQTPSTPALRIGTVSRVGTMSKTVQISYNTQRFDRWHRRHTQHTTRILAHEPTGYLREGDVVQFARFTPATMADRYESGMLDRRGGGVRHEVHRVVTPFAEPVEERSELAGRGELWERLGSVEFERRRRDLARPWNRSRESRVRILEGMYEALAMEVQSMRALLGPGSKEGEGSARRVGEWEQQNPATKEAGGRRQDPPHALSDAEKDIAAQLQKPERESSSAAAAALSAA